MEMDGGLPGISKHMGTWRTFQNLFFPYTPLLCCFGERGRTPASPYLCTRMATSTPAAPFPRAGELSVRVRVRVRVRVKVGGEGEGSC